MQNGGYTSNGNYSGLIDEYTISEQMKNLPQETVAKLRKAYEFKAFLENWEEQWSLRITSEAGWLNPPQRKKFQEMLRMMREDNLKDKELLAELGKIAEALVASLNSHNGMFPSGIQEALDANETQTSLLRGR